MMRTRRAILVCMTAALLAAWTLPLSAAEMDRLRTDERGNRRVTAGWIVMQLRKETGRQWAEQRTFARTQADFVSEHRLVVENRDLVLTLARTLHPDPEFDAYLKWQLMALSPDLSALPARQAKMLIEAMPAVQPQREPEAAAEADAPDAPDAPAAAPGVVRPIAAGRPTVSVVQSGAVVDVQAWVPAHDPRYVTMTIGASQADVIRIRRFAAQMAQPLVVPTQPVDNTTILRYREQLIERLPREAGLRLVGRWRDVRDRLAAGEPSAARAAAQLADEADALGDTTVLEPDTQRELAAWVAESLDADAARAIIDPSIAERLRASFAEGP